MSEGTSTTPWRRDPALLEDALTGWAGSVRGGGARVSELRTPASGMANDTILFRLDDDALVARLAPEPSSPYQTFPTFDLHAQRRVIELVRERTEVPVPEIVHHEESAEWLGVPFLVTRAVDGVVPSDNPPYLIDPRGWFLQGSPDDWRRLERSTIEVLTRLHRIVDDETTAFLRPAGEGPTALARQLHAQRAYYEWARDGRTVPILEHAFDRLAETLPANDRAVLNWGDSRPGNIIYRDFEAAAVLDWEMATVGPPEVDLAWTTFFQRFFASMARQWGIPEVPGVFARAESVATYEELSGDHLDDLAWYEAFAGLRFGIILTRMSLRSIAFGVIAEPPTPDDLTMFAPLLRDLLADL